MILAFLVLPPAIGALWLLGIRPYCIKNGKGYTPGMNMGASMWMDWQSATNLAKKKGDRGMVTCCRIFLALNLLMLGGIIAAIFS